MTVFDDICQMSGCENKASRLIAQKEGPIMDVCSDCYWINFKS